WLSSTRMRCLAASISFMVPAGAYLLLFSSVSIRTFLTGILLTTVSEALLMWHFIYRRAPEWHERIEPAVVDLLSPLVILPILVAVSVLGLLAASMPDSVPVQVVKSTASRVVLRMRSKPCCAHDFAEIQLDTMNAENLATEINLDSL